MCGCSTGAEVTMISLTKLLALASCLLLGRAYINSEFQVFKGDIAALIQRRYFVRLVLFGPLFALVLVLVLLAPFLPGTLLRLGLVSYLGLSAISAVVHRNITGQYAHQRAFFDEDAAEVLLREIDMVFDAVRAYRRELLAAALPGALIMGILMLPPSPGLSVPDNCGVALIALIVFIAVCYRKQWIFIHGKGWPIAFPSIVMIPIKSVLSIARREVVPRCAPARVTLTPGPAPLRKLVFVMDESIRGDYTTLGNRRLDTTPYLAGLGEALVNFGVATSGHNCSSYSRYLLRHGSRMEALPQALAHGLNLPGPTIWQYAKAAGLRTVYIDGFANDLRLHSGMSLQEARGIDKYIRIPAAPPHARDAEVADCLIAALADPVDAFIYVDKYGIHQPYENKVPPGASPYQAGDGASRAAKLVAAYKNAVRWNVDGFFRQVLEGRDLTGLAMIYTSDHGQSLLEGGYSISHCSIGPDIVVGEALVPLAAILGAHPLRAELRAAAARMLDRASHFDIFPTLLVLLGYDPADVAALYGAGLLGAARPDRRFLSGFKTGAHWVDAGPAFPRTFHPPAAPLPLSAGVGSVSTRS
jgi:lipid A ethanolaminephosphotransferase